MLMTHEGPATLSREQLVNVVYIRLVQKQEALLWQRRQRVDRAQYIYL